MRYVFLLIALLPFNHSCLTQELELGGFISYGKSTIDSDLNFYPRYWDIYDQKDMGLGLDVFYRPSQSYFELKSGLNYRQNNYKGGLLHNLQIPIGVNFSNDDAVLFSIGAGVNTNLILNYNERWEECNNSFRTNSNAVQVGVYYEFGFGFKIKSWKLLLIGYYAADVSVLYNRPHKSPGGSNFTIPNYSSYWALKISFRRSVWKSM